MALAPRFGMNVCAVGSTLVDAGTRRSVARILPAARELQPTELVLTHAHPDHQGGAPAVCKALGLPLWAPAEEADAIEQGDFPRLLPDSLIARWQLRHWQGEPQTVDRSLHEGDPIGADFLAIETPGHSPGHLAFFRESDRTLIVGDVVWGIHPIWGVRTLREPPGMFTLNQRANRASIRKLAALRPNTIVFGHGPALTEGTAEKLGAFADGLED